MQTSLIMTEKKTHIYYTGIWKRSEKALFKLQGNIVYNSKIKLRKLHGYNNVSDHAALGFI